MDDLSPVEIVIKHKLHLGTVQNAVKWFKELERGVMVPIKAGIRFVVNLLEKKLRGEIYELTDGVDKKVLERDPELRELLEKLQNLYFEVWNYSFNVGYEDCLDKFTANSHEFCYKVMKRAQVRGLRNFKPVLFTAPCKYCGKPMVFAHRDPNWDNEVKPQLHKAFSNWYYIKCSR